MKKPRKCGDCRERSVDVVTERYETDLEHDGRSYKIILPDLTLFKCGHCGNIMLPDEAEERLTAELRRCAGLMEPSNIVENRLALGLNQKELADLLGVAVATLCRWERGTQLPQKLMDKVMRHYFQSPRFRKEWNCPHTSHCAVVIDVAESKGFLDLINKAVPLSATTISQRGCTPASISNMYNNQKPTFVAG